jgi:hypothetical protein
MKWKKGLIVEGGRHLAWHVNDPCLKSPGNQPPTLFCLVQSLMSLLSF